MALIRRETTSGPNPTPSRQVGKTTLDLALCEGQPSLYLEIDLKLPGDLARLAEPQLFLSRNADKLEVLDEIQRAPRLFIEAVSLLRAVGLRRGHPERAVKTKRSPEILSKNAI